MSARLDAYLHRIGFAGTPRVDLDTLTELHRRHLLAIPYESLDVMCGVPVSRDPDAIHDKLVSRRRGGWCYEMNGLLGWALEEIGFDVMRMAGGVMRATAGDGQIGNHLVLCVRCERDWLVDVGFGDGMLLPVPLAAHAFVQLDLPFRLERLDDGFWRFHNQPHGGAASFDFQHVPADPDLLDARCAWLQSADESPFRQVGVCQRFTEAGPMMLRGRVLRRVERGQATDTTLPDVAAWKAVLRELFGIEVPGCEVVFEAAVAWEKQRARA